MKSTDIHLYTYMPWHILFVSYLFYFHIYYFCALKRMLKTQYEMLFYIEKSCLFKIHDGLY